MRTCTVLTIILQRKIQTNVESFSLTAKLNAVSENVIFLRCECVKNEVTVMHKFSRRKFSLPGYVMHRFHANFAPVNVNDV